MTDHTQKLIVMQTLLKEVLPVVFNQPGTRWLDDGIKQETEKWCHYLYGLAGRIGPQEQNTDVEKMPPATTNKYIKGIRKCVQNEDGPGLLELYDELNNGQRLWVTRKLYSDDAAAATKLIKMVRDAENQPDPNFELYEEVLSEKDARREGK